MRFAVQVGEPISLASNRIGNERAARVVDITDGGVHCAFEHDLSDA
jgi:hypothetical protein